jgi:uncharacterized Rmd1/YagE family protein
MDKYAKTRQIEWNPRPRKTSRKARAENGVLTRPILEKKVFEAKASMVAERIDIKRIVEYELIAKSPYMYRLSSGGVVAVFRYGAAVFFGVSVDDRDEFLSTLREHSSGDGDAGADEVATVEIDPVEEEGPSGQYIKLANADKLRIQLVAEVMAKASMLSFQERRAAHDFDRSEPLAQDLAEDGRFSANSSELLKAVGSMLLAETRLNGRAGVMDRPDLLWDNPALSGLYARLEGDYELQDRAAALDRKLATLSHTSETLVETMRYHSSHRLEFAIFLLIFVELCMALYQHVP